MYKTILVPVATDHSPHTKDALEIAQALLAKGGKIIAVHAVEPVPSYVAQYLPQGQLEASLAQAEEALEREIEGAKDIDLALIHGSAGQAIIDYAEKCKADLIVIASHKPGLQDYFLGSTAARVVRHAQCAVHVVR
ncbi:MAG: universal stress protein [Paracoccaceae bacterium]